VKFKLNEKLPLRTPDQSAAGEAIERHAAPG
jgi:hypothetical protein